MLTCNVSSFYRPYLLRSTLLVGTDRTNRYCANLVADMPTLVWRRRSEGGTGAAGGDNARNTAAAVPDEVVSAAASAVPDAAASAVPILPDPAPPAAAPAGAMRKVNRTKEKPKAASERDLPRCVCETSSGKFKTQIRLCGKLRYIGCFDTVEQASAAHMSVKKDLSDANISAIGTDEADAMFDVAQKIAVEAVGGVVPKKRKSKATSERDLPTDVRKTPSGKFDARIQWRSKYRYIGIFDTPEQASAAYLSVKKDLDDVNLSAVGTDEADAMFYVSQKIAVEAVGGIVPKKRKYKATSERDLPRGVRKTPSGKFKTRIQWGGERRYIGTFDTPEQASAAYVSVRKDLDDANLSAAGADEVKDMFDVVQKIAVEAVGGIVPRKKKSGRDLPRGVYETSSGKFKTKTMWDGKYLYIGTFDTADQASAAYLSVKKDLADVNLSAFSAGQVNTAFDAAKKIAIEAVGGVVPKKRK